MADDNTNEAEAGHKSGLRPSDANIKPQGVDDVDDDRNKNIPTVNVEDTTSCSAASSVNPVSREGTPPPLPPRPRHQLLEERTTGSGSLKLPKNGGRPSLQSKATTAVSQQDIQSFYNGAKEVQSKPASRQLSFTNFGFGISRSGSDADDSASVKSFAPTLEAGVDVESLLGEALQDQEAPAWKAMGYRADGLHSEETLFAEDPYFERAFGHEFDEVDEMKPDGSNEGQALIRLLGAPADRSLCSYCNESMEIKTEALHDLVISRKAYIQSPRRRSAHHQLHWHRANAHFLLPRREKRTQGIY